MKVQTSDRDRVMLISENNKELAFLDVLKRCVAMGGIVKVIVESEKPPYEIKVTVLTLEPK